MSSSWLPLFLLQLGLSIWLFPSLLVGCCPVRCHFQILIWDNLPFTLCSTCYPQFCYWRSSLSTSLSNYYRDGWICSSIIPRHNPLQRNEYSSPHRTKLLMDSNPSPEPTAWYQTTKNQINPANFLPFFERLSEDSRYISSRSRACPCSWKSSGSPSSCQTCRFPSHETVLTAWEFRYF